MALRLPRRPKLGFRQVFGRWGNVIALIGLSALLVSTAKAQAVSDGRSGAAVTVDNSVLEQLGPARAPAKTTSSIHLIPRKSSRAAAAPTSSSKASHQKATISAPTTPAVAALVAPPPAPKPSASGDGAMPSPQQARDQTPPASAIAAAPSATAPAPAAPSPSAAAPAASAPPVQMASATTVGKEPSALKFKPGATDLGSGDQPVLDAVATRLLANESLRVQLVSHATGGADDAMAARRVSLARAVAIRAYLADKGVQTQRIIVRALGNLADNGPVADQVDLVVVSQ